MHRRPIPRPAHLGPEYAAQFQDVSVVRAYQNRGPFPSEVFSILLELINETPRNVLDIGCGRGEIARELVNHVDRVDAVDFSAAMIEAGKGLPGGDHPHIRWICSKAEDAPMQPPYVLVTAGNSLHWMDWDILLPAIESALTPRGYLAIVEVQNGPTYWDEGQRALISEYSTNREFRPYNLIDELKTRGLFRIVGFHQTDPCAFAQTVDEYIEAIHSQNGFSRERMSQKAALEFDDRLRELISPYASQDVLSLTSIASVTWGRPLTR